MSDYSGLGDLVRQIRETSANIRVTDERNGERLAAIEKSVNELYVRQNRPGAFMMADDDAGFVRKSATEICHIKHALTVPKDDGIRNEYVPDSGAIDEALAGASCLQKMLRRGDFNRLDNYLELGL